MSARNGVLSIGTATAPFLAEQTRISEVYGRALSRSGADPVTLRRARSLFRRSRAETRQFVLPDFTDPDRALLYRDQCFPAIGDRMRTFERLAPALAEQACRKAIERSEISLDRVSHLVVATCTGVGSPDLDVELVGRLGLSPSTQRTMVVWMSCTGAFPAMRVARRAVSDAPGSIALVVAVELCSIHARAEPDPGSLLAHALFADGAGAMLIGAGFSSSQYLATFGAEQTELISEGRELLRWEFGDGGFCAHIDLSLPELIEERIGGFVRTITEGRADAISSWCVHPGGIAILDGVERALKLSPDHLAESRRVLSTLGNMSSATLLYVLERELRRSRPGDLGLMLGFGTGITIEGLRFTREGRAT